MDIEDRELLELAAKALGMSSLVDANGVYGAWVGEPETGHWWNPIAEDGDALRLAVSLSICVDPYTNFQMSPKYPDLLANITDAHIRNQNTETCFSELHEFDPFAATRRAIVRAAAEIGRAMP